MATKFKPYPVHVTWIDSVQSSGWGSLTAESDLLCESFGMLIKKPTDRVTIAMNHDVSRETYGMFMEIPTVAVKKMKRIRL